MLEVVGMAVRTAIPTTGTAVRRLRNLPQSLGGSKFLKGTQTLSKTYRFLNGNVGCNEMSSSDVCVFWNLGVVIGVWMPVSASYHYGDRVAPNDVKKT